MYVRTIGRRFTQMNAYFLVMNSKRCTRDFTIRRRDLNENVKINKQTIGLEGKTTTLQVHHTFLYISLPFLNDYDVKLACVVGAWK